MQFVLKNPDCMETTHWVRRANQSRAILEINCKTQEPTYLLKTWRKRGLTYRADDIAGIVE